MITSPCPCRLSWLHGDGIPSGRFATPEEVAQLVAFLLGPHGGYVNGSALVIDGGLSAHLGGELPSF